MPVVPLTPEQRRLRAQIAAHSLHAQVDSTEHLEPARRGFLARFEREVDPDGVLPADERERRARSALRAHMNRLALASSRARARRRAESATSQQPSQGDAA